jgi:hypothetical protein
MGMGIATLNLPDSDGNLFREELTFNLLGTY